MPCYKPTFIPHPRHPKSSGIRMLVGCGYCLGCRVAHSRMWVSRLVHESYEHENVWFLTMTYDDEHLFQYGLHPSLNPPDVTLFLKSLRKYYGKLRYFYCGEYGEKFGRPHYHMILFGPKIDDLKVYSREGDHTLYTSNTITSKWGNGSVLISLASPATMAYTCGYAAKKFFGPDASLYYSSRGQVPPFVRMSLKPGIGANYVRKYSDHIRDNDFVWVDGFKHRVPRYYDTILARAFSRSPLTRDNDPLYRSELRQLKAIANRDEYTPDRLYAMHMVALAKFSQRSSEF